MHALLLDSFNNTNEKRYTYADYAKWDTDVRYELIDGVPYAMAAPTQMHQTAVVEITRQLGNFLKSKKCQVFVSPFDVCLFDKKDKDSNIVQPDILVVCDKSKLDGKRLNGAPDMVIEVLSPASENMDRVVKFNKYQKAGVREYWIVDTEKRFVSVFILENGKYYITPYLNPESVPVNILDGCVIDMKDVFPAADESEPNTIP